MLQQLMWIEVLLKAGVGLVLLCVPGYAAAIAGLPPVGQAFWPRLLGATLVGIAAGLLLQGHLPAVKATPPAGLITINLALAGAIVSELVLAQPAVAWRGRALLWFIAIGLGTLSLFEIHFA